MKNISFFSIIVTVIFLITTSTISFADGHPHPGTVEINGHTHIPQTEVIPIDGVIGIEKTTIFFHAPPDNTLPWGFVEGKVVNPVTDYPVIIQFFNEDGEAVHFAQTGINTDGVYEYKFRVRDVDNGNIIRSFEGDYSVFIFKVVYLQPNQNLA